MQTLDKSAIGQRIKHLRKTHGLRQWQMAQLLGATQPAVHKYENGILPEVKRLLELARIGNTSVEWVLTGHHWENGSGEMDRMPPEVFELARQIHSFTPEERRAVRAALEVLHSAAHSLKDKAGRDPGELSDAELGRMLRSLEAHILSPLMAALAVYEAVVTTMAESRTKDLRAFTETGEAHADRANGTSVTPPTIHKSAR